MKKLMKCMLILFVMLFAWLLMLTACDSGSEPHTHSYGEWMIIREPTCIEEGSERQVCECGDQNVRSVDKTTSHRYTCGICRDCQEIARDTIESLNDVVKEECVLYWNESYKVSDVKLEDMEVTFDYITPNVSNATCRMMGLVSVYYNEKTFKAKFNVECIWSENNKKFVKHNSVFEEFYAYDESNELDTFFFPSLKSFCRYTSGGKAVLTFYSKGSISQSVYTNSGIGQSMTWATYSIICTPDDSWIITVTSSNGNEETMYYYGYSLFWDDDIYTPEE